MKITKITNKKGKITRRKHQAEGNQKKEPPKSFVLANQPLQLHKSTEPWESIAKKDKQLELFLKTLPKNQLTRVMAGLQQTQSNEETISYYN